ncbi:MAG: serine hydrolase domain-containing protein [Sphingomonas sp.]
MQTNRRGALGAAAIGLIAGALPAQARGAAMPSSIDTLSPGRNYATALAKLRDYAAAELETVGLPGMTLSIADADGFTATLTVGWADREAQMPVRSDHLFEIGSISKSLTALCIHNLAEEGLVDLDAPVARYLEGVPLPGQPVTVAHLLNHAGGFAHDAPIFPNTPDGKLWCGFAPGSRFSYSNIGYRLLGLVIEKVTGRPHPEVIEKRVLAPLGMAGARAHLLTADRARFATGYVPFIEDRPTLTRARMIPGSFTEGDFASGAVAASGTAMLGYLRYVLALGRGKGAPLMSDAHAGALLANDIENEEFGPHSRYASGFATVSIDGKPALHHTGGMILFTSSFHVDPAAGVACFASVNGRLGPYRPRKVTTYAVQLMRAVRDGAPLPDAPDPYAYRRIEAPQAMVGRWFGSDGRDLTIVDGSKLMSGGATGRIEPSGKATWITDHPELGAHPLEFELEGDRAVRMWWGTTLFARDTAPAQPSPDPALEPLAGVYTAGEPFSRNVVVVRGGRLFLEGDGELIRHPEGHWSPAKDEGGVTRLWLTHIVNGKARQLSFCGDILDRLA